MVGGWEVSAACCRSGKARLRFLPRSLNGAEYEASLHKQAIDDRHASYHPHHRKSNLLRSGEGFHVTKWSVKFLRKSPISEIAALLLALSSTELAGERKGNNDSGLVSPVLPGKDG